MNEPKLTITKSKREYGHEMNHILLFENVKSGNMTICLDEQMYELLKQHFKQA
jgi:hypothetical protein